MTIVSRLSVLPPTLHSPFVGAIVLGMMLAFSPTSLHRARGYSNCRLFHAPILTTPYRTTPLPA